jgi:hypothetical protein
MRRERRRRILDRLAADGGSGLGTRRLCEVCADVTGMSGAGIMLMSGDIPRGSLCSTNAVSGLLEELQFGLGEGPSVDAYNQDRAVSEPDLAHPLTLRWSAFTGPALEAGARAVFGFPLQVGAVRLGAINLYGDQPGALTDQQFSDALVVAGVGAEMVLLMQAKAPPGVLAAELESEANFHYVVHQASGMVAAQLDISVVQALVRLRAFAFGNDRELAEVAKDVVARQLHFGTPSGEKDARP